MSGEWVERNCVCKDVATHQKIICFKSGSSFEPNRPRELKLGYVQRL